MPPGAERPRVVFDTNVLISALAFSGVTRALWRRVQRGDFDLFVSAPILAEMASVLTAKIGLGEEESVRLLDEVLRHAHVVIPTCHIAVVHQDDADNRVLECAVEAHADVLVTGDLRHLRSLATYAGIRILTPAEFRDAVG
jgi:putative PIN family toxin of toxin-antitoxin system